MLAPSPSLCIAVGAGAAGALNMWYDSDIDRVMRAPLRRPVPSGRVPRGRRAGLRRVAGRRLGRLPGARRQSGWPPALLAFTILFYVVVYTMWLKRRTPQNIVIGGAAGALPPMIGWAAVTGTVTPRQLRRCSLIIFLWTPPHFWALALYRSDDYARAGIPMLPVVAGLAATQRQMLVYSVLLAAAGVAPAFLGMASPVYGVAAAILGGAFVFLAWQVFRMSPGDKEMRPARRLFAFSLLYLFLLFAMLLAEHGLGGTMTEAVAMAEDGIRLTEEERRRRRGRSIAIAVALAVLVALFYALTLVKFGGGAPLGTPGGG